MNRARGQHLLFLKVIGEMQAMQLALHVLLKNAPDDLLERAREFVGKGLDAQRSKADTETSAARREEVRAMVDGMEQATRVLMP